MIDLIMSWPGSGSGAMDGVVASDTSEDSSLKRALLAQLKLY